MEVAKHASHVGKENFLMMTAMEPVALVPVVHVIRGTIRARTVMQMSLVPPANTASIDSESVDVQEQRMPSVVIACLGTTRRLYFQEISV